MNENLIKKLQEFSRLSTEHSQVFFAWIRQVLTIATGSLAVLVAFQLDDPIESPQKFFLLTTWITLGIGILAGTAAAFQEVAIKASLRRQCSEDIQKILGTQTTETSVLNAGIASWVYSLFFFVMVGSFFLSVVSLVVYASMQTL